MILRSLSPFVINGYIGKHLKMDIVIVIYQVQVKYWYSHGYQTCEKFTYRIYKFKFGLFIQISVPITSLKVYDYFSMSCV